MKQTSRIISTYSADTFGVCSALFELGGMVVMHDASGCNSTYTTHDEPRWFDMDSMVYISGLSEMEAIMGDDEKLLGDIEAAAQTLHPKLIAIAGTPIPAMTGFDYRASAELLEKRTGIPTFGFPTTGMNTYVTGGSMALEGLARRFVKKTVSRTERLSANILGVTPLDFSTNGADRSIREFLENAGFEVISSWAMGSTLEEMAEAGRASVNLVVSGLGLGAAQALKDLFGTPYVTGVPIGRAYQERLKESLLLAAKTGKEAVPERGFPDGEIALIGEGIAMVSLAGAIELTYGKGTKVLCATECRREFLREKDVLTPCEEDVTEALRGMKVVIGDPLYQPICPKDAGFLPLPSESFSGRIYRKHIPNLITEFEKYFEGVL